MIRATRKPNLGAAGITDGVNSTGTQADLPFERHFSPSQLAELWELSPDFIRERFRGEPGVIRIDRPETCHKRGYSTIRIPKSVAARVHAQLRAA
jgi:hypothetical protein